jgi:hypothetical protein
LSLSKFGTRPPPPTGTRWNVTLFSDWAHSASVSVPEPAEVMPTFLPSSSFADVTGELVFTPRIQPDHSSPLPPTILTSTPRLREVATSGTATVPISAEFAAIASKVSPPPR